jgi:hypothetical protein
MALRVEEFLRRYFLHGLPQEFVRIRHFGLFCPSAADGVARNPPPIIRRVR